MNVVDITKKLIKTPSWVSSDINEAMLAELLCFYLSGLKIKIVKQEVSVNRYNIIGTIGEPKIWLCGHMDTVELKNPDQLKAIVRGNKLYGLGSVDMKAGIAAIIDALSKSGKVNNIGILFYCDEEYSFLGMKKFINSFDQKADLAIITEPTDLKICNAHRGIIEFEAIVKGQTGHASRPQDGVSAINGAVKAVAELSETLKRDFSNNEAGTSTCNLSKIKGGTQVSSQDEDILYMSGTNSIPDTAEIAVDIRPAVISLTSRKIESIFRKKVEDMGCTLGSFKINNAFGPLITKRNDLFMFEKCVKSVVGKVEYSDPSKTGYGDGQMLFEKTGTPVVYFGPGPKANCHKKDEYVDIDSIKKTAKVLRKVIESMSNLA